MDETTRIKDPFGVVAIIDPHALQMRASKEWVSADCFTSDQLAQI